MRLFLFLVLGILYNNNLEDQMSSDHLLLYCSFEDWTDVDKWEKEICKPGALTQTTLVARKGKASIRFELEKSDSSKFRDAVRAELRLPGEKDRERWYGFSNYLPVNFEADPLAEIIAQWHEIPDWELGEKWRSPPISLGVENDRFYVKILWAMSAVNTNKSIDGEKKVVLRNVEKGKWNDWIFHIRFSYQSDGIIEIWENGQQLFCYNGPNSFNDRHLPYFKIGIYKWGWNGWAAYSPEDKRVIYYDEVKIGDRFANVATFSVK